jgi:hypothetical protein
MGYPISFGLPARDAGKESSRQVSTEGSFCRKANQPLGTRQKPKSGPNALPHDAPIKMVISDLVAGLGDGSIPCTFELMFPANDTAEGKPTPHFRDDLRGCDHEFFFLRLSRIGIH